MKTGIQERIEWSVTNGRSYQEVPYTKLFGKKCALEQWLIFSKFRCVNGNNSSSDKTSLIEYFPFFIDRITEAYTLTAYLMHQQESFLERRVEGDPIHALVIQRT